LLLQLYSQYSLNYYCKLFGKSRQAYYEQKNKPEKDGFQEALILKLVAEIRKDLPRCGTDKLYFMLKNEFLAHQIKIGRDGLYRILGEYGLLIRYRKRKPYTTNSNHYYKKYPNLIRHLTVFEAGKLWVSDITYIRMNAGFAYLSIITDAYSYKIVGYKLHPTLHAKGAIDALMMASKDTKITKELIHHSDRGIQYCCHEYVEMIDYLNIQMSMTENGDPYENAVAERINGILKYEHGLKETFKNLQTAQLAVDIAVKAYNELRIHDSCNRLTPIKAHEEKGVLKKYWKKKVFTKKQ
jgi:transposase InsO family protein